MIRIDQLLTDREDEGQWQNQSAADRCGEPHPGQEVLVLFA